MFNGLFSKKSFGLLILVLIVLTLLPHFLPRFYIYLLAVILVAGLLATSLNVVLGFGGMFQFHHGVFYGFGAYTAALVVTKAGLSFWLGFAAAPLTAAVGLVTAYLLTRQNFAGKDALVMAILERTIARNEVELDRRSTGQVDV